VTTRRRREPDPEATYDDPTPGQPDSALVAVAAPVREFTEPVAEPDQEPSASTVHRVAGTAPNFMVVTRCSLTVVVAKATRQDAKVTCGNCKRIVEAT